MAIHPTWEDVSIPDSVVNSIKPLAGCYYLDSLLHQFVYRYKRKPQHTYACRQCGFCYKPDRSSEEIACCPICQCGRMRVTSVWRWGKEVPPYTRTNRDLNEIIDKMSVNYISYFGTAPTPIINCGWASDCVYCQFKGGNLVRDYSSRLCFAKAAILCPYLWDTKFDWNLPKTMDTISIEHFSPIANNYCHPAWLTKPRGP